MMNFEPVKKLKENNKRKMIFLVLTIIMCLGISFGATYFIYNNSSSKDNTIESGLVSIDFTEKSENINLATVPVTDEVGLLNDPYVFTLENTSEIPINAKIQIQKNESTTIALSSVKCGIYIDNSLIEITNLGEMATDGTIYTIEEFQPNSPVEVKLVFWIDYYYETPGQVFNAIIKVTGESYDIIVDNSEEGA